MAKERLFNLNETKGSFQLKGIITGVDKENFYSEKKTKTGKDFRRVNFGVEYADGKTLYINLQGMPMDNVYYSKRAEKKGEKGETVKVPWADRHTFNREGFQLIGNNIGVKKIVDKDGKLVNDKKRLTDFDTCKELAVNLKDGQSVFIRGKLEFSSFKDNNGDSRRSVKLVPTQISLCADIDFKDDKFEAQHDFNQVIVFESIEQEKQDDKPTGRFIVSSKIVNYSTIEPAEFIIEDNKFAMQIRKGLKPYWAIKVNGHMVTETETVEVDNDDCWGEEDSMERVNAPVKREFIITGAKPSTIDKELYSQSAIEEAMVKINNAQNAKNDFAGSESSGWGSVSDDDSDDEAW